jgi:hypothetical protein
MRDVAAERLALKCDRIDARIHVPECLLERRRVRRHCDDPTASRHGSAVGRGRAGMEDDDIYYTSSAARVAGGRGTYSGVPRQR